MGYTHYFRGYITLREELISDIQRIINASGVQIAGTDGQGEPELVAFDHISLNGADDESHETLWLNHGVNHTMGGFTKTANKPYDVVVCAVLLRVVARSRNFVVESDGDWNDVEEWVPARQLYFDVFAEEAVKPTKVRADEPAVELELTLF